MPASVAEHILENGQLGSLLSATGATADAYAPATPVDALEDDDDVLEIQSSQLQSSQRALESPGETSSRILRARVDFADRAREELTAAVTHDAEQSPFLKLCMAYSAVPSTLAARPIDYLLCSHSSEGSPVVCPSTFTKRKQLSRHLVEAHQYDEHMCARTVRLMTAHNGAANLLRALETIRTWASLHQPGDDLDYTRAAHIVRVGPPPRAATGKNFRFASAVCASGSVSNSCQIYIGDTLDHTCLNTSDILVAVVDPPRPSKKDMKSTGLLLRAHWNQSCRDLHRGCRGQV